MRDAPSIVLASRLLAEGATVRAWDPVAVDEARSLLTGVELTDSLPDAVTGSGRGGHRHRVARAP